MRALAAALCLCALAACARRGDGPQVVVYTSVDQVYAEPILRAFEAETGVRVAAVYDIEAAKTTGLANRILAEQSRPRADVFWNGEFLHTLLLKRRGALAAYDSPARAGIQPAWLDRDACWSAMGARVRVLLVNTRLARPDAVARSLDALLDAPFRNGRAAVAYPLFGTSATHAAALYAAWGPDKGRTFYRSLRQHSARVVDGNSVVRDLVGQGQVAIGLTDSDDACGGIVRKDPVAIVIPDDGAGAMIVPGTVALVRGAPHAAEGRRLVDWLLSPAGERRLIGSGFCQFSVRTARLEAPCPAGPMRALPVPLDAIAAQLEASRADMEAIFAR